MIGVTSSQLSIGVNSINSGGEGGEIGLDALRAAKRLYHQCKPNDYTFSW